MKLDKATVGKRYATALFELAVEDGQTDEIYQDLLSLRNIYKEIPTLGDLLSDVRFDKNEKRQLMDTLVEPFSGLMLRFLEIVFEYNRMDDFLLIFAEFERRYDDQKGLVIGTVTTAVPLNSQQKEALESKTASLLHYQQAKLEEKIDPTIIGGVIVEANHQVIDGSVKSRLDYLRAKLAR